MSKKHRHEEHEEHVDESWLIPYADLLTLLLALFIVLYSMNSVDVKKFQEMSNAFNIAFTGGTGLLTDPAAITTGDQRETQKPSPSDSTQKPAAGDEEKDDAQKRREELIKQEQEDLEKLKKQIDDYIKKNGLTSDLETKLNQSQLMITISDEALFASGSSEVKEDSRELATSIATMLQQYPDYEIIVSGHTDNKPINTYLFRSNWDLSTSRAVRFMDILLENKQLSPTRFTASGYGENRPLASNDTEEGRAKNRRVEVSIIRNYVDLEKAQELKVKPKE
ncbi:flagellar motor protein MotB [Paenibacillus sp. FSL H8-0537]|uniref:flagellar motor protein MotB n=1 Tax=Paenibacillus sp. FSL H8-0537 TaxID=2921399 RepID=UPI0031013095